MELLPKYGDHDKVPNPAEAEECANRVKMIITQMTKAIIEKYPFIKDRTPKFTEEELKQGYKDIADIWKLKYSKVR